MIRWLLEDGCWLRPVYWRRGLLDRHMSPRFLVRSHCGMLPIAGNIGGTNNLNRLPSRLFNPKRDLSLDVLS